MDAMRDKTSKMTQEGGAEQQPSSDTITVKGVMKPVMVKKASKMGLKDKISNDRGNI